MSAFGPAHADLLLQLLALDTVTPMETAAPSAIAAAQELFAQRADAAGFARVVHEPAPASALARPDVPAAVVERAEALGPEAFLAAQPNMVLRLGPRRERRRTLMLNAHFDTVGPQLPARESDGRFHGRGAVDMKGPAVAALAGVEAAVGARPDLAERVTVLFQCVAGEEGGAMGVYGTRVLVEAGFVGALNVFAEPTGELYVDRATASMTASVAVRGDGATDDHPDRGHNATIALGFVAAEMADRLAPAIADERAKLCVGGLHTGTTHDRVYGSGELRMNLAYRSTASGARLELAVEEAFDRALDSFAARFARVPAARRTARDIRQVCTLRWLKRGLPTLDNRDPAAEQLLAAAGLERLPDSRADEALTCDAIWGGVAGGHSIVFGPGSLAACGAHGDDEHVPRVALERYADALAHLVLAFDERAADAPPVAERPLAVAGGGTT